MLRAYGWHDIEVPPYCPRTDADHQALEAFQDEIIDRLFVLNAERAEEERIKGITAMNQRKGKASGRAKRSKSGKNNRSGQASLFKD